MKYMLLVVPAVLALSACDNKKDYQSTAQCQQMGLQPGTPEYDKCVSDQKMQRMLEQQRKEYESMKQYDRDEKLRDYRY